MRKPAERRPIDPFAPCVSWYGGTLLCALWSSKGEDTSSSTLPSLPSRPPEMIPAPVSTGDLSGSVRPAKSSDTPRVSPLIVAAPSAGTTTSINHLEGSQRTEPLSPSPAAVPLEDLCSSSTGTHASHLTSMPVPKRQAEINAVAIPVVLPSLHAYRRASP